MVCILLAIHLLSFPCSHNLVPVIAIYTKFDDLVNQVYDMELEDGENRQNAIKCLEDKFEQPLDTCKFPPKAHLHLEGMYCDLSGDKITQSITRYAKGWW